MEESNQVECEESFSCPYCGESISMILDYSAGGQTYIEDCEVCCRPIQVSYSKEGGTTIINAERTK